MNEKLGSVTIAGAGPGQRRHLTLAVLEAIYAAEVILYDALVDESIIREFPLDAEAIFVGKRCGTHAFTQTMIIHTMIERALRGKKVLRLKGGDPAVFAQLSSELDALATLGIAVEVLPGVSALLTAAAELKAPLTERITSRHVWITDGHGNDIDSSAPAMAKFNGTLVFYMAAGRTLQIAHMLLTAGIDGKKCAALVENAGTANAAVQRGTIEDFAKGALSRASLGPGIFLVGDALRPRLNALSESHEISSSELDTHATTT